MYTAVCTSGDGSEEAISGMIDYLVIPAF